MVPSALCVEPLLKAGGVYHPELCGRFFGSFLIPNGVWIVVPFLVVCALGKQLSTANARFKGD